jgi:beta-phosphoglucomutase-like phosphatase (HAD superfamily)
MLGIRHRFARIVDVRDLDYESKPQPAAYRRICAILGVRPEECVLVEDNVRNLQPAKAQGMVTVLVDSDGEHTGADHVIQRVEDIGGVLRRLNTELS